MIPREVLARVKRIEIYTNRLVNEVMAGSYHSTFKGQGMEFEEVREYAPGDDVRAIDWNVTARAGHPYIKRYREERELTALLMVDLSGSTEFGGGGGVERTKGEFAAEICALLAFAAIKNNDRVGLLVFTDHVEKFIPPKKGKNHVLRVVREVLTFKPTGKRTNVAAAAQHAMRVLKRKSVIFLVSDLIGSLPRRPLAVLNGTHDLVAIRVRDRREFELPPMGMVSFEDPETGEVFFADTFDPGFRRRFAQLADGAQAEARNMLRELRVDFADVRTDKPYMDPIVELFRRRAGRY